MIVYLLRQEGTDIFKVGITKDIKQRVKSLQTGCSNKIEVYKVFESENASRLEATIHNLWTHKKIMNEWFNLIEGEEFKFIELCSKLESSLNYIKNNKI